MSIFGCFKVAFTTMYVLIWTLQNKAYYAPIFTGLKTNKQKSTLSMYDIDSICLLMNVYVTTGNNW